MIKKRRINTLIPRDFGAYSGEKGNMYEAVVVVAKRANIIAAKSKQEINEKLQEFASKSDDLEEVFENKDQIILSKYYEKLPKPVIVSTEEFLENKLMYRYPED